MKASCDGGGQSGSLRYLWRAANPSQTMAESGLGSPHGPRHAASAAVPPCGWPIAWGVMTKFVRTCPCLSTRDLARTIEFYASVLDFTIEGVHPAESPTFCILERDDVRFMFETTFWPGAPSLSGQLCVDVDDARAVFERVKDHAEILWGPEVFWYGRREFSCRDPNGYALVFSEQTDDPPTCPED